MGDASDIVCPYCSTLVTDEYSAAACPSFAAIPARRRVSSQKIAGEYH
jgi:hypothetical protein